MDPADVLLLLVGGLAAGVVNTLAGGGSLLTVPLLVLAGVLFFYEICEKFVPLSGLLAVTVATAQSIKAVTFIS